MHARNRTWLLGSDPAERCRQRTMPVEGGDGSTLTLDFTTGVLDPRLSFTRASNATFINSSGYVQFANANLMTYSNPRQTGTAWGATGTVTWGSSTLTDPTGGSAAQSITFGTTGSAIFNTSGTTVVSGITHTFSVWMRSATGTTTVRIGDANVAPVATVTLTTTWQRFSCQYTTSGTNDGGAIYSQTGTPSAEFYVWGAQVQPGSIVGELIQTSGTINTNTPRFDYDPTTLAPRGLLVEGQVQNLVTYSDLRTTGWAGLNATGTNDNATAPDGTTTATLWTGTSAGQNRVYSAGFSVTNGQSYTISAWVKKPSSNAARYAKISVLASNEAGIGWPSNGTLDLDTGTISGTGYTVTPYQNGWYRIVSTGTVNSTTTARMFVRITDASGGEPTVTTALLWWGAQAETGSGASSLIPTGASQGTRNADKMSLLDITPMQWNQTAGTFALSMDVAAETNTTSFPAAWGMYTATPVRVIRGLINNSSGTNPRLFVDTWTSAPAQIFSQPISRPASPALTKFAFALSNSGQAIAMCVNNGAITTGSGTGTMQTPTRLLFHQDPSAADTEYFPIHIRSFKYWPTNLPNAQLQSITT